MDNNQPVGMFDYWDEHPDYPVSDWKTEVINENTRLGYWTWVRSLIDMADVESSDEED